jgi:mono/diheme cytochrome c family protein
MEDIMHHPNPRTALRRGLCIALMALAASARGETAVDFLGRFEAEARAQAAGFAASPARGANFFKLVHGSDWSCASCHSDNPAAVGKHAKTGKPIEPLAPTANAERFVRADKVDKWFKRNCNDVLGRACSPAEKADVVAWLISVKK